MQKQNLTYDKTRLEAFSDGVRAIIITIKVLELKVPHSAELKDLLPRIPIFFSYILSFVFVGIYWGNHHHLIHTVHHVNSKIIWANMHLLFWLSLIPFTTAYMGENHFDKLPVAFYGVDLLFCAMAYQLLHNTIIAHYKHQTKLSEALQKQGKKGYFSLASYLLAIPLAFYLPIISALLFVLVAVLWVIPDKNIERALKE